MSAANRQRYIARRGQENKARGGEKQHTQQARSGQSSRWGERAQTTFSRCQTRGSQARARSSPCRLSWLTHLLESAHVPPLVEVHRRHFRPSGPVGCIPHLRTTTHHANIDRELRFNTQGTIALQQERKKMSGIARLSESRWSRAEEMFDLALSALTRNCSTGRRDSPGQVSH